MFQSIGSCSPTFRSQPGCQTTTFEFCTITINGASIYLLFFKVSVVLWCLLMHNCLSLEFYWLSRIFYFDLLLSMWLILACWLFSYSICRVWYCGLNYDSIWAYLFLCSLIQQAQKFFMETNDSSDARNVCFCYFFIMWISSFTYHVFITWCILVCCNNYFGKANVIWKTRAVKC